ncbi:MAG: GNAT family N-acetyltransferase [Leptodesmis sp.]
MPLDPTQLRWQQFWVIEFEKKVIACGQLRLFEDAQELGSLVVAKGWRNQGLGSVLARHLIQKATQPLYLECLGQRLATYYQRFGFGPVDWDKLPRSLQQKFGTSKTSATLLRLPLVIMHCPD